MPNGTGPTMLFRWIGGPLRWFRSRDPGRLPATMLLGGALGLACGVVGSLVTLRGPAGPLAAPTDLVRPLTRPHLGAIPDAGLPLEWSRVVYLPGDRLSAGMDGVILAIAFLAVGALVAWALGAAVLLHARGERRRGEYLLHRAVGAPARGLRRAALREAAGVALPAAILGAVSGWVLAAFVASGWPGGFHPREMGLIPPLVPGDLPLVGLLLLLPVLLALGAVRSALVSRRLDEVPPPGLGPLVPVFQCGVVVALLYLGGALGASLGTSLDSSPGLRDAIHPGVHSGAGGEGVEQASARLALDPVTGSNPFVLVGALAGAPGVTAASVASLGTAVGPGVQDIVVTQCGACSLGGLPTPLRPVPATLHAVSPDTFTILGVEIMAGRGITLDDAEGAEPVAVISRSLARDHFDREGPLGRELRVGATPGRWVRIVGIVEDRIPRLPDAAADPTHGVYLSAGQFPPERVELVVQGPGAGAALAGVSAAFPGEIEILAAGLPGHELLRAAAWWGTVSTLVGWLALVGAVLGVAVALAHRIRERQVELALRRAVGATRRRIALLVLADGAGIVVVGALFGCWLALLGAGLAGRWVADLPLLDLRGLVGPLVAVAAAGVVGIAVGALRAGRGTVAEGLIRE